MQLVIHGEIEGRQTCNALRPIAHLAQRGLAVAINSCEIFAFQLLRFGRELPHLREEF